MTVQLDGKVALVSGAGGEHGLGRAIALHLARDGADVAVTDLTTNSDENWGGLPAVAAEIEAMGRKSLALTGSVIDSEQVAQIVASTLDHFGRIDILVNSAGAPAGPDRVPVVELDEHVFDRVQAVNVKGTFLVSQAVARHMLERGGGGKIINMSSLSGRRGKARYAAYCASKFAIIGFTQALAAELGEADIQVNALCPGLIESGRLTDMATALRGDGVSTETYREFMIDKASKSNPMGRVGTPGDVATAATWLASSQSDYVTGQSINISGGDGMGH